jgi:hypothetical protein
VTGRERRLVALVTAAAAAAVPALARAQTMLDQEQRLIDIHSLLLDLPPLQSPGALRPGRLSVGLEAVTIPDIDGQTGGKVQITASDRTPVFPRPRIAYGLPAPEGFRAMVGISYIPPLAIRDVSTHYGAAEAGLAWVHGLLRAGARGHVLHATSRSPVTDPGTRDTLETLEYGADASVGASLAFAPGVLEPYAGAGVVHLRGRFRVTSDGTVLRSEDTSAALHAGLRFVFLGRLEAVAELSAYPGRLVHTNLRAGYLFF